MAILTAGTPTCSLERGHLHDPGPLLSERRGCVIYPGGCDNPVFGDVVVRWRDDPGRESRPGGCSWGVGHACAEDQFVCGSGHSRPAVRSRTIPRAPGNDVERGQATVLQDPKVR